MRRHLDFVVKSTLSVACLLWAQALCRAEGEKPPQEIRVTIDAATVVNTMRGGLGASWHAIEQPMPYSTKGDPVFGLKSHGGSGWGAYPPAEDAAAWAQIDRHARWLGLDWNRVELEQRIYEPERGQFTWDSREMRILYRILDWCQKNRADVFLQQMWGNVRWNTYPEWRDDVVGRIHSAPYSIPDFADGLAALVEHLVKKKGYTCIRWLSIINEPGHRFSWWQQPPNKPLPLRPGLEAVRKALDARGIGIPLAGGETGHVPPYSPHPFVFAGYTFDFQDLVGAYDPHTYDEQFDWLSRGSMAQQDRAAADWTAGAHKAGKAYFFSEFGTMANGWGADHAGPGTFESALKDTELALRRIAVGVDGLNRWSFINRGDLDGQWQFIDTWDRKENKLLAHYTPHANTYFVLGLLSRFTAKHSDVLACQVDGGRIGPWQRVFATALRSPKGNLTLAVVNDAPESYDVAFALKGLAKQANLYRYAVSRQERDRDNLKINPQQQHVLSPGSAALKDRLAPMSLTIYSTYKLAHSDDGVIDDQGAEKSNGD